MTSSLTSPPETPSAGKRAGLGMAALTALVVGSMIGSGIFALPSQMAGSAAPGPLLIGWVITGVGMLMLAFVFQTLATRKPDVDGGVYGYARAGFGNYIGFTSAFGYWVSAWVGNVAYLVLLFSTLGYFFPAVRRRRNGSRDHRRVGRVVDRARHDAARRADRRLRQRRWSPSPRWCRSSSSSPSPRSDSRRDCSPPTSGARRPRSTGSRSATRCRRSRT